MGLPQKNILSSDALKNVFIQHLSILYSAKNHLSLCMPYFIEYASFNNLKLALGENMEDNRKQMLSLSIVFQLMDAARSTEDCFGIDAIIKEATEQVIHSGSDNFTCDMAIILYMGVIENLQIGAFRVLDSIAANPKYLLYAQLIRESHDIAKDNAKLFHCVAEEYLKSVD